MTMLYFSTYRVTDQVSSSPEFHNLCINDTASVEKNR